MIDQKLKKRVEEVLGQKLVSSADYDALSQSIQRRNHILLSTTTLKRIFGYLKEDVTPRRATLDVLAQYVGYRDYDDFMNASDEAQSIPVLSDKLDCSTLAIGQNVRLTWAPNRDCVVRYEGRSKFKVISAKNTKLSVGDTFVCHMMIQHEPLYLDEYVHNNLTPSAYVAGRLNGVTYQIL